MNTHVMMPIPSRALRTEIAALIEVLRRLPTEESIEKAFHWDIHAERILILARIRVAS